MDAERCTTLNLTGYMRMAKECVVFINTGFLDYIGDELYISMDAGALLPKDQID